jgi:predicted ArsR family transcriptional regulator
VTVDPIRAVAALDDELRRGMYAFIRAAGHPVTRDEAAAAVGISRKLAAFHLDKLVDVGVLRPGQATGVRRVGRAPKVYEPTDTDIRVGIPFRHHETLAEILLSAVLADGTDARRAAIQVAHDRGKALGEAERQQHRPGRLGAERAVTLTAEMLQKHGFEPARESPTCLRLRTCPFHPLAERAPEMVCGINHAFLSGVVDGLGASSVAAVLDPRAGECCVELHPAN